MAVFSSMEFESEEERRLYLVREFPRLVREGKFVQTMGFIKGHSRVNWLFAALNRSLIWITRKMESSANAIKRIKHGSESMLDEAVKT